MAIIGDHPERGVRFVLERPADQENAPFRYTGAAFTPESKYELAVEVDAEGSVTVISSEASPELKEKTRLLVRTMVKHAAAEGGPPPRRILRWRPPS